MDSHFAVQYSYLIPLLPLIGAAVAGLFGARWLKGNSHWPIWGGVGIAAVISISLLIGMLGKAGHKPAHEDVVHEEGRTAVTFDAASSIAEVTATKNLFTWISAGNFKANAGFFLDPLTAVMLCVVTGIGFFITVFAKGYMAGDAGYFRFFAYLGLFIFAMTCLVMGENFLMLYLGWEGVGLCSYLLIGYYYDKPAAREAAKKAFLVNRVGDFGFGLGIMLIYMTFGTVSYFGDGPGTNTGVLEMAVGMSPAAYPAMKWIPFLLMLGAFGKSAQFPLYVWLPDAMEGPTPVSALIHAATMVTAGVYMIARCGTLFVGSTAALWTIAIVGAFTAIFAATIALRQVDLKKVFAYSTISQLGFMFVGVGVLAPVAGVFHLVTHAFFKALLFLSSGVVMHAMMGELDMRKMSGLKSVLPKTRILMLIGCLALAGFPFLSGFFSKDEIVIAALERSRLLGGVMLLTALLTAYYTFRLYFRVFEGPEIIPPPPAGGHAHGHAHDDHAHASASAVQTGTAHESGVDDHLHSSAHVADTAHGGHGHGHHNHEPLVMVLPLAVLAIGAIFAGYLNWPKHGLGSFLGHSPSLYWSFNQAMALHGAEHVNPDVFGIHRENPDYRGLPHSIVMGISGAIAVLGIALAYLFHLQDRPRAETLAGRWPRVTRLLEAKYWVDEVYQAGIVEPMRKLGKVFFGIDRIVVDGLVFAVGFIPQLFGFTLKLVTQRGSLQGYAAWMLLCIALILLVVFM